MVKAKVSFECEACGYVSPSYLGRCPECQAWQSFSEQRLIKPDSPKNQRMGARDEIRNLSRESHFSRDSGAQALLSSILGHASPLSLVTTEHTARSSTGFAEMDRVLGGGLVSGSYVLIGGDPGIGKSTLLLQMASHLSLNDPAKKAKNVLYIAGEESPYQIKLRAERLKLPQIESNQHLLIYADNNIERVIEQIKRLKQSSGELDLPDLDLVIIDSIQSMYSPDVSGTPGSVSQVKECAGLLMEVAKSLNVTIFLIGHVTKDGSVSGPKLLEHTVDAVLYFEGDKYKNLRILRTVKNRFGSTQEIGIFEMGDKGLSEVENPSRLFLSSIYTGQGEEAYPGSAIVATLEGSRPILTELQALVGQSTYPSPRRIANGVETNRLHQIVAVLERRLGLDFSRQDIYINVVGGLTIDEPAADLGMALAIVSSLRNIPLKKGVILAGEVGLTGEIRPIHHANLRIQEASRLGFSKIILPAEAVSPPEANSKENISKQAIPKGAGSTKTLNSNQFSLIGVRSLMESLQACFDAPVSSSEEFTSHVDASFNNMPPSMSKPPLKNGEHPEPLVW
ncbi:MAG: DNA repair protein RadA [Vampirovibrionales bacterium]|nr:DNA repair protein RadA [Vampirovibrionales bacterium]